MKHTSPPRPTPLRPATRPSARRAWRVACGAAMLAALLVGTRAGAEGHGGGGGGGESHGAPPEAEPAPEESLGDLAVGRFRIVQQKPGPNGRSRLSFVIHFVPEKDGQEGFPEMLASRRQRARDQVLIAMRMADPRDFQEPDLKALRKRIKYLIRRAIPDLPVGDVYFSEFDYLVN